MFESKINRGRANGYAPLDGEGKVPLSKLPPIQSTIDTGSFVTANQTGSFVTSNQTGSFATTSSLQTLTNRTGSFATTGSNQFYGNQSISGSVNISSSLIISSTFVNNGTIDALNSDLIIDGGDIILTGSMYVSGSLIPNGSGSFDLGSEQNPWRDLYISTASIKLIRDGEVVNSFSSITSQITGSDSIISKETFLIDGNIVVKDGGLRRVRITSGSIAFNVGYDDTDQNSEYTNHYLRAYYGYADPDFNDREGVGLTANYGNVYLDTIAGNVISNTSIIVSGSIYADNLVGLVSSSAQITQFGGLTKNSGSWTVEPGTANYSFTLESNNTYQIWVLGNVPNGIISYNGMVTLSNTNVPVIGSHNAWNYTAGNELLFTSIPNQIVTTSGSISTIMPGGIGTNTNTFTFGITNNAEENVVVNYGYVKIS